MNTETEIEKDLETLYDDHVHEIRVRREMQDEELFAHLAGEEYVPCQVNVLMGEKGTPPSSHRTPDPVPNKGLGPVKVLALAKGQGQISMKKFSCRSRVALAKGQPTSQ